MSAIVGVSPSTAVRRDPASSSPVSALAHCDARRRPGGRRGAGGSREGRRHAAAQVGDAGRRSRDPRGLRARRSRFAAKGSDARDARRHYFFETLVTDSPRERRGAVTGLKPAGQDLGPRSTAATMRSRAGRSTSWRRSSRRGLRRAAPCEFAAAIEAKKHAGHNVTQAAVGSRLRNVLCIAAAVLIGRTAMLGGQIRHTEVRDGQAAPPRGTRRRSRLTGSVATASGRRRLLLPSPDPAARGERLHRRAVEGVAMQRRPVDDDGEAGAHELGVEHRLRRAAIDVHRTVDPRARSLDLDADLPRRSSHARMLGVRSRRAPAAESRCPRDDSFEARRRRRARAHPIVDAGERVDRSFP